MQYQFNPNYEIASEFNGLASISELAEEVGVYAADLDFVREHCGPLAQRFLDALPEWYHVHAAEHELSVGCDIRLHALLPGQYPASPGWHCDAAIRETKFAHQAPGHEVAHNLVGCISSHPDGVSNTEFLVTPFAIESEAEYGNGAELWAEIDQALNKEDPEIATTADGALYLFDPYTLHRVAPARRQGLRLFFRASLWTPPSGHQPGISRNEQVYRLLSAAELASAYYLGSGERLLGDFAFPAA